MKEKHISVWIGIGWVFYPSLKSCGNWKLRSSFWFIVFQNQLHHSAFPVDVARDPKNHAARSVQISWEDFTFFCCEEQPYFCQYNIVNEF